MTILQIVNRVLRRLREDAVTSLVETDYSRLIVDFLHDTHQECIERHDWSAMEHVVDIPVDAAQRVLDLSRTEVLGGDVVNTSRVPKNDSAMLFDSNGLALAWLFDNSSAAEGDQLFMLAPDQMERQYQQDRDYSGADPVYFSLTMHPDRGGLQMTLWPPAPTTSHIRLRMWTPEDEVDEDTDSARELLVPSRPLILGTLMLALNERGEELGEPGNTAEHRYYDALSGAVEQDVGRRAQTNRYEARRE
jgi:hypothetical protein